MRKISRVSPDCRVDPPGGDAASRSSGDPSELVAQAPLISGGKRFCIVAVLIASMVGVAFLPAPFFGGSVHFWPILAAGLLTLTLMNDRWRGLMGTIVRHAASRSARHRNAIIIIAVSMAYLLFSAYQQGFTFDFVRLTDEHSYLLQMKMLEHGRLWYPAIAPPLRMCLTRFRS